jgi:ParB/RepB/Spo0J family partition protein
MLATKVISFTGVRSCRKEKGAKKKMTDSGTQSTHQDVLLDLIDSNPYNSRLEPSRAEIDLMVASMSQLGLLSPIMVRPKKSGNRYELVFGHRRVLAARHLGWNKISAEVKHLDDEGMIKLSFAENVARKNLSDYEKGLCFSRMKTEFRKTLVEIGKMAGISESHVCNFVRMTELFDYATVTKNPKLLSDLCSISEHHARILLRIPDSRDRQRLLRLTVADKLSVRDLQRMMQRFRSWFPKGASDRSKWTENSPQNTNFEISSISNSNDGDLEKINEVVLSEFRLPRERDYDSFTKLHEFDGGYSIFSSNPPLTRFDDHQAVEEEKRWFFGDAVQFTANIRDMRVQLYSNFAVVTLFVDHRGRPNNEDVEMSIRGTLVVSKVESSWKIVHEHWSNEDFRIVQKDNKSLPGQGRLVGPPLQKV